MGVSALSNSSIHIPFKVPIIPDGQFKKLQVKIFALEGKRVTSDAFFLTEKDINRDYYHSSSACCIWFGHGGGPRHQNTFHCRGTEHDLSECFESRRPEYFRYAGIKCQGIIQSCVLVAWYIISVKTIIKMLKDVGIRIKNQTNKA